MSERQLTPDSGGNRMGLSADERRGLLRAAAMVEDEAERLLALFGCGPGWRGRADSLKAAAARLRQEAGGG